jgi:galactokinase
MRTASAYAPGRVELLGNHTDYNEGFVLSAAIDKGTTAHVQARSDSRVVLTSQEFGNPVSVQLDEIAPLPRGNWANYPLGVTAGLMHEGFICGGFEARFESTLAIGAGLSSSAALEVATAKALAKLFDFQIDPHRLAKLCRRAENEYAGVSSGLLDQISSLFGQRDHVIFLDCRTEEVRLIKFPAAFVLLILESGVPHRLSGGEYNERREQCFEAARQLGVAFLRDADMHRLESAKSTMDAVHYKRALHVIGENARVQRAIAFLDSGRIDEFGALMFESHASSRMNFENSTPELDTLVELARIRPEIVGSRLTGGGFGGATISLAHRDGIKAALEFVTSEYERTTGNRAKPLICEIADGAR